MIRCPVCNCLTIDETYEEVIVDICPVCFWQYDIVAQDNPNRCIGPNDVSLNEAIENYKQFGACSKRMIQYVRKPHEDEL